jgi:hypothetical protein
LPCAISDARTDPYVWLSRSAIRNRHSIDPHGAGNIIDLLLAQILKAKGQPGSRTIGCQPLGRRALRVTFFCDSNIDWPVAAVPTCVGPDKPPKYPAT